MSDTTASYYYLYNANGNVSQLVNAATGEIAAHYEYDPFGNLTAKSGIYADANPFRHATQYFDDEISLYAYKFRYYSPELGRWTSRDPIGEKGGQNLYAFVLNNTNIYFDPLGLNAESTFNQWINTKPHKRVGFLRQRSMFSKELIRQSLLFVDQFKMRLYYLENKGVNVDCLTICELDAEYLKERQEQFEKIGWLSTLLMGGASRKAVNTSNRLSGFTEAEANIVNEARAILDSREMVTIRAAHNAGESVTLNINGRIVQYEAGLNASGMTMFGEEGFVIGNQAFSNSTELTKTVLHELYRLNMSASAEGVSAALITAETEAAFNFAERACSAIIR